MNFPKSNKKVEIHAHHFIGRKYFKKYVLRNTFCLDHYVDGNHMKSIIINNSFTLPRKTTFYSSKVTLCGNRIK